MEWLALLISNPLGALVGFGAVVVAIFAAIFNAKRKGRREGVAQAQQQGAVHVEKSKDQAEQIRQSTDRVSGDDARDRLRNKWGRP